MRSICLHLMAVVFVVSSGCSMGRFGNEAMMRNVIVDQGGGEQIYAERITGLDWRGRPIPQTDDDKGIALFWQKPDIQARALVVSDDAPPEAARQAYQTLITHRLSVQVHTTDTGNRLWVIHLGRVIASFNYVTGVAILGDKGHPSWAVGPETTATSL